MQPEITILRRRRQTLKHQIKGHETRLADPTAKLRAVEQELLASGTGDGPDGTGAYCELVL